MKVIEIFGEPISNGGQESFVMNVIEHMDRTDMQIDLLTPYYCDNESYRQKIELYGGKIIEFGLPFAPGKSRFNINKYIDKFFLENCYDVAHIHSGSISILCIMAKYAKKHGVKRVITHSHCAVERINMKNRILRLVGAISMRSNVDTYCACSVVAGEAKYMPFVVKNKMLVLKNGVDMEVFKVDSHIRESIRQKLGIDENAIVVGHVGRFSYQKNHEYLIEVFANLKRRENNAVLMLIGTGELLEDVKAQVSRLNLESSVFFCGIKSNVNDYMQAMDVFVLPSRYEGLPIVGVEAQASGLPVVTSDRVSTELKICKTVKFLPLKDDYSLWTSEVLAYSKLGRQVENIQLLKDAGYEISQTSKIVRDLYMGGQL